MLERTKRIIFASLVTTAFVYMAGCASPPDIRIDYDKSVDFYSYKTYGYVSKLGTDDRGYSTLVTEYFKEGVKREMESLGYTYSDTNPDLLVNFSLFVEDKTDIETFQNATMPVGGYGRYGYGGYGYYGYRRGLYNTYPVYDTDVRVVNYKEGTANIDVVDAEHSQLIWEALVEGRLSKKAMKDPEITINKIVSELFKKSPPKED